MSYFGGMLVVVVVILVVVYECVTRRQYEIK
jgi:hypothetical protein